MVDLADSATAPSDRQTVLRLFSAAEGIASLIEPKDYSRYHLPQPGDDPAMGNLVLATKEGYVFSLEAAGDDLVVANPNPNSGSHGFLSTEPKMNAIFVASGPGSRPARRSPASRTSTSPRRSHNCWAYRWKTPRAACSRRPSGTRLKRDELPGNAEPGQGKDRERKRIAL